MKSSFSESYKAAGVDITAGYDAVKLMKKHIQRTMNSGVVSDIGGFGGLFQPDMTSIKKELSKHLGQKVIFKANRGRRRSCIYEGHIENIYDSLFTIAVNVEDSVQIQSYTYGDVLTRTVEIKFC